MFQRKTTRKYKMSQKIAHISSLDVFLLYPLINMLTNTIISLLVVSALAVKIVPLNDFKQSCECSEMHEEEHTDAHIESHVSVHPSAVVEEGAVIGENVEIGTGAHIHSGAVIKDGVKIPDGVEVDSGTVVEDNEVYHTIIKHDSKPANATATTTKTVSSATATASNAAGKSAVYGGIAFAAALGAFVL